MSNTICAWCHPGTREPHLDRSHGICRKHEIQMLASVNQATPEELDELWDMLEPRAATAGRICDIAAMAIAVIAVLYLSAHVAWWRSRGFHITSSGPGAHYGVTARLTTAPKPAHGAVDSTPRESSGQQARLPIPGKWPTEKNERPGRAECTAAGERYPLACGSVLAGRDQEPGRLVSNTGRMQ